MSDEKTEPNPFSRPGFIIAAVSIAALVAAAVIIGVNIGNQDSSQGVGPSKATASTSSAEPAENTNNASICGLKGEKLDGTVTIAPKAEWAYMRTTAYPTSREFGPADKAAEGYPRCFQHSPEGALFATATAIAVTDD
ncbi:MAG: hypothetical protein ACRCSP_06960 [Rhodoglobus sp.]